MNRELTLNGQVSFWKDFKDNIILALPVMFGHMAHIITGIVDTIMLGAVGEVELAAAALGNSIFVLTLLLGLGIAQGVTPYISYANASRNTSEIKRLLRNAVTLNLITGFILAMILVNCAYLLRLPVFGQDPAVVELTIPYLHIIGYSLIPMMLFQSHKQLADGLARTWVGFVCIIVANIVNVIGNYALIYGNWGFEAMGVEGAGLGTFISRCSLVLTVWIIFHFKPKFRPYLYINYFKEISLKYIKKILKIGIPSALQSLFESGVFTAAVFIVGSFGATYLNAHQISMQMFSLTFSFSLGFAVAGTIRSSFLLGKRDFAAIRRVSRVFFVQVVIVMSLASTFFIVFRNDISYWFIKSDSIAALSAPIFIVAALFQIFDGLQIMAMGILKGLRDVIIPTLSLAVSYWLVALPLAYVLGSVLEMKLVGVWVALAAGLVLVAIFLTLRLWLFLRKDKLERRYERISSKDTSNVEGGA